MQIKNAHIKIINSPVIELLSAMFRIANHSKLNEQQENQVEGLPAIDQWVELKRKDLPDELLQELEIFFNKESFLGLTLIPQIIAEEAFTEVHTFFGLLHKLPLSDMFNAFTHSGYSPDFDLEDYQNPKDVIQYLEKINLPKEEKWKLSYLIFDGERTKQRLIQLIERFYYQCFQQEEVFCHSKQEELKQQLEREIAEGNTKDIIELLEQQGGTLDDDQNIYIFPSYFLDLTRIFSYIKPLDASMHGIGVRYFESHATDRGDKETLEAIKVLTDERRFQVVQMLQKQAYYGYELAQALNVSNSTISHHLAALQSHRLVKAIRVENKVYFELNKQELKNVMVNLEKLLLDDI